MKRALITGITGQDGSYLAELLLGKGYEVHGVIRRSSSFNTGRIDHLYCDPHIADTRLMLHYGDLADPVQMVQLVYELQPDEIYHLGAQSHVRVSFDIPEYTGDITGLSTVRILDAIRRAGLQSKTRFYQASSSEMFGQTREMPQTELTSFHPASPCACAKAYAYWLTVNYRESSNGILVNHESPRRGETFVTRKITRAATRIKVGLQSQLFLGNLEAQRDWGFAGDYVEAMWRMLQQDQPDDYVIATQETHSVREFCEEAFSLLDLDWQDYVQHDPRYDRPSEVARLVGNPAKAKRVLNWEPRVRFKELVALMIEADLKLAMRELTAAQAGDTPSTPAPVAPVIPVSSHKKSCKQPTERKKRP
jgi:GDPmannose 4,6-dehydratase